MAVKELVHLATTMVGFHQRDLDLESTTEVIPELARAIDKLHTAARVVNHRMMEVGAGPTFLSAQNAVLTQCFQRDHTWGTDTDSLNACKSSIAHFQQRGFASFSYILQIGLLQQQQQQRHVPESEWESICSRRASFVDEIECYMYFGNVPILSQFMDFQLFTPRELLDIPDVMNAIIMDGRPDYLGRSVYQTFYDAGITTNWPIKTLEHTDSLGRTVLHQAVYRGDVSTVKNLNRFGANFGQSGLNGMSAIHISACQGHVEMLGYLAARNKYSIDTVDRIGRTAFWYASRSFKSNAMAFLAGLRSDVDMESQDMYGLSPLAVAARGGHLELIKTLLKLRSKKWNNSCAPTEHSHDHHPLLLAAKNSHWECVDLILAHRTWYAGDAACTELLNIASQRSCPILQGKLKALWRVRAGYACLTTLYGSKSTFREPSYDVDFSQSAQDSMPCEPFTNA